MWLRQRITKLLIGFVLCSCSGFLFIQNKKKIEAFELPNNIESSIFSGDFITSFIDLSAGDFGTLIDLKDFKFLKNKTSCNALAKQPTVVVAVHTAPKNFLKRDLIRETWGFKDPRALLIFLIGLVEDKQLQHEIDVENELHGDIVQGNFIDAYRNLTYKHVMAFKWMIYNCPEVPFLLKLDDDVFVNTPLLYDYLETPSEASMHLHLGRLIFCIENQNPKVKRSYRSKWRVSYDEYPVKHYPDYCEGCFILYSTDVAIQLYQQSQMLPYFWIDDVHLTGTVALQLKIPISSTRGFILNYDKQSKLLNDDLKQKSWQFFSIRPPFGVEDIREVELRKLWRQALLVNSTRFGNSQSSAKGE